MNKETIINYLGIDLTVVGKYEPEEKQYMYESDLGGYKGYPAQFEITKVITESGDDILGIFMDFQREDIIELALINLEN